MPPASLVLQRPYLAAAYHMSNYVRAAVDLSPLQESFRHRVAYELFHVLHASFVCVCESRCCNCSQDSGSAYVLMCLHSGAPSCKMITKMWQALLLYDKVEIIRRVKHGKKKSDVAAHFEISRSTLSTILKNKSAIRDNGQNARMLTDVASASQLTTVSRKPCSGGSWTSAHEIYLCLAPCCSRRQK